MSSGRLTEIVAAELDTPLAPGVHAMAETIRRRFGEPVAAILFYGSCLRAGTTEGIMDFYVLVDRYRAVYRNPKYAYSLQQTSDLEIDGVPIELRHGEISAPAIVTVGKGWVFEIHDEDIELLIRPRR